MASAKAPVLGGTTKADLPKAVFSEPFHESLVHESARADLAARRRGTAAAQTRAEVSMTTAKAWRQKGLGRARVGALSAPHRKGGGAAFGPKPRRHTVKVNRKARRRALRAALSAHAERGTVAILDAGAYDEPATKRAATTLESWGARRPTLLVLAADEVAAAKSFRNIPRVAIAQADAVGVADVIGSASLVVSESALPILEARASAEVTRAPSGPSEPPTATKPKAEPKPAEPPKAAKPKAEPKPAEPPAKDEPAEAKAEPKPAEATTVKPVEEKAERAEAEEADGK
jgi:large subunit ribosomal protein L4